MQVAAIGDALRLDADLPLLKRMDQEGERLHVILPVIDADGRSDAAQQQKNIGLRRFGREIQYPRLILLTAGNQADFTRFDHSIPLFHGTRLPRSAAGAGAVPCMNTLLHYYHTTFLSFCQLPAVFFYNSRKLQCRFIIFYVNT